MTLRKTVHAAALVALILPAAACGGSDTGSSSGGGGKVDRATAQAFVDKFTGTPGDFPVDVPLEKRPEPGTKLAQLQFGTPVGGLVAAIVDGAAKTAGVDMAAVKAGTSPATVQAAANSLIELDPDAVLLPASDPAVFPQQLKAMKEKGVHVSSIGTMNPHDYDIEGSLWDERQTAVFGKLMASWVVADKGADADVVFFGTPELSFSEPLQESFKKEFETLCPGCSVSYEKLAAAEVGSSAPGTVVSYLQGHPKTNTIVYASIEGNIGVPSALQAAGLDPAIVGFGNDPTNLQYLKEKKIDSMLTIDLAVGEWTAVDAALRLVAGQELTKGQIDGDAPAQLLRPEDVTFDVSKGWTGYPDFAERFAKLWLVGQ